MAILKSPVPDITAIRLDTPSLLADLIARCLAVQPSARPSALEAAKVLRDIKHEFLGELGGAASTSSAVTDVSGPPIEVLQAQLAAATRSASPMEVNVLRGDASVDLTAATDEPSVSQPGAPDDGAFFRRPQVPGVARLAPRPQPHGSAAILPPSARVVTLDAGVPMQPDRIADVGLAFRSRSSDAAGAAPTAPRRLPEIAAVQDESDRLVAQTFARSFFDRRESERREASVADDLTGRGEPSARATGSLAGFDAGSTPRSPRRTGKPRARALVGTAFAAPLLIGMAVLAGVRLRGLSGAASTGSVASGVEPIPGSSESTASTPGVGTAATALATAVGPVDAGAAPPASAEAVHPMAHIPGTAPSTRPQALSMRPSAGGPPRSAVRPPADQGSDFLSDPGFSVGNEPVARAAGSSASAARQASLPPKTEFLHDMGGDSKATTESPRSGGSGPAASPSTTR